MNHPEQQRTAVAPSTVRIETLESLREHLQWAIELEHATLPPYLCALYSLDPSRNPEAVQVVGSVFAEEMIHLALAANLLNAVGGQPRLDTPQMLPRHPRRLAPWRPLSGPVAGSVRGGSTRDVPPPRTAGTARCSGRG
jgi:hypothetical protein